MQVADQPAPPLSISSGTLKWGHPDGRFAISKGAAMADLVSQIPCLQRPDRPRAKGGDHDAPVGAHVVPGVGPMLRRWRASAHIDTKVLDASRPVGQLRQQPPAVGILSPRDRRSLAALERGARSGVGHTRQQGRFRLSASAQPPSQRHHVHVPFLKSFEHRTANFHMTGPSATSR